jgi:lipoate-protein ligase A
MTKGLFAALDVYHDISSRSAAMNMAIDEALLEIASAPCLRFYGWDHPAISFGYFGKFADVAAHADYDIVRRWTGGGIVFHGNDLTYSLIIPAENSAFAESPMSIYEKIHRALRDALVAKGQRADLVSVAALCERRNQATSAVIDRRYNNSACFANPVRADVLLNGRKIAGAAQRRTCRGLLQQGSIQLAAGRVRPTGGLANGFAGGFAEELCDQRIERLLDAALIERAQRIAAQRYETQSWLQKR